jgi:predicted AAA+ superfamily ATPase
MDRNVLQQLITTWNPHFEDTKRGGWVNTIPREKYLTRIEKLMDIRHAVFLTGVRRSGKSTIVQQLIGRLIERKNVPPRNILYLYLDDILVQQYLSLGADLLEQLYAYYKEQYNPQGKVYLFLDEVQGVNSFNRWVATRYEHKEEIKFILSGSRKSLIESETATLLTGRNVLVEIYPLNFYEYLQMRNVAIEEGDGTPQSIYTANYHQHLSILHHIGNYFVEGGFPEIVLAKTPEEKTAIANSYYRDIVTRDVLIPNSIRNASDIEVLGLQILSDFTKTHTYSSLGKPHKLSVDTVKNYLKYFTDAYLFFENQYFSYKTKESQDIQRPRKIYVVDNGMRNFNVPIPKPDIGYCAENVVYMELKKTSVLVSYWIGKQETDFVVQNGELKLFNSSYTDQLPERELTGILEGLEEFNVTKGVILTKNYLETKQFNGKTIEFIPLWAWLIANSKTFFKEQAPVLQESKIQYSDIPVLDIEPSLGGSGGSSGHFVHFPVINTGEKVAIDCQWGIRGFGYEWRSPDKFVLRPGEKKIVEYQISGEKPFRELVPELNIFFEYKDNMAVSYFSRRELIQEKVPSGAFYNITKTGTFHPAVVLQDSKIRKISEPYIPNGNFTTEVIVDVDVSGEIKKVRIGMSPGLPKVFGFSQDDELKAAFSELAQRKVRNMLSDGNLHDVMFSIEDLPKDRQLSGFESYKSLRDSLD